MKFSNRFVVVVVAAVMKDDGYIHASVVAVCNVVVEVDTTSMCMLFPKFQINCVELIYWTALTICLEEQKNE
jgi:hypothetical protein